MASDGAEAPRVRFSPAPSGNLHVGSARTALFNWIHARKTGGTFILRIEDTDAATARPELVDQVLDTLRWLGTEWDEGPYRQSERADLYTAAVDKLLANGSAYRCDCTTEDVDARAQAAGRKTPGYDGFCRDRELPAATSTAVRFRTPDDGEVAFDDVIRGHVSFPAADVVDFVIQRADGSAIFLLANAVDDLDMRVTHVIRGEDLLNTVPKQLLVMQALGHDLPVYAHLPLLVDEGRKKLSKRRHSVGVNEYRERGYLPAAFTNFLATLGWGPPDGVEIRPMGEIVELFELADVTKSGAFFDAKKLDHFNGEYLRALDLDAFVEGVARFLPFAIDDRFRTLAPLVQERCVTFADAGEMVEFLYRDEPEIDPASWDKAMQGPAAEVLDAAIAEFEGVDAAGWNSGRLHEVLAAIGERLGLKLAKAQAPVRVAVTGKSVGPPLFESLEVLGRDATVARLRAARSRLGPS
ncbi:MAG TPA: glutamate--tRNA ligase [Acidimicrobiia bacterium]|nr:glutamate--tRNA ligase [Acidimicrobiia bacterium]